LRTGVADSRDGDSTYNGAENIPLTPSEQSRQSSQAAPDLQGLWVALRSGQAGVNEQLFKEVYQKAYPVALKILANQQDAEDAAQECALRFYKVLHDLDPSTNIAAYVYRMAVNAVFDRLRQIKRRHEEPLPVPDVDGRELASKHPDYEDEIDKKQLIERLAGYIEKLPEKQRQAILLKELEDMSLQEMADTMGYPVATAKNWVYRGIDELRKHFSEREERHDPNVKKDGRT
jgi:RNA polymerase sigma-70 factor (ECF subfamily)